MSVSSYSIKEPLISQNASAVAQKKQQPKALKYLFFAELWERFSFYGMQSILILYLVNELGITREISLTIVGAYGTLVYGSNILGGYIADNFLGMRRSILVGSVLIILGHATLALPYRETLFYGLAFIVVGTGFFKVNVSSFLGEFYGPNDSRRDAGFTFFYMGINVGALLATFAIGIVMEVWGWHASFGLAAIGMLFGLIVFISGNKVYGDKGLPPKQDFLDRPLFLGLSLYKLIILGAVILVPMTVFALKEAATLGMSLYAAGVIGFLYILYQSFRSSAEDRKRMLTLVLMYLFVVCFFSMFKQLLGALQLYADESVNRIIELPEWISATFGLSSSSFKVPTPWILGLNSLFIIILSPIVAWVWRLLPKVGLNLLSPIKMAIGIAITALSFYILYLSTGMPDSAFKVSLWMLILGYACITLGELLVSPVSLSMVTKLSPNRFKSFMMGFYFFSLSLAYFVSAQVSVYFAPPAPEAGAAAAPDVVLESYGKLFIFLFEYGIVIGGVLLVITPFLRGIFKRHE